MGNRKLFLRYPPEWERHPDVVHLRVRALEEEIEEHLTPPSNNTSAGSWMPTAILFLLYTLGGLGLVSPEKVVYLEKLFGN